jgi:2-methylcitrate dehydratase PrpD
MGSDLKQQVTNREERSYEMFGQLSDGKPIARFISEIAADFQFADLPVPVVKGSKRFILDILGCILGAKNRTSSKVAASVITSLGGEPQSTLIGYSHKTSAPLAAFANATAGHAFDMDDDHREGTLHCSVVVFPAVLAAAEQGLVTGSELIAAYALGSELMIRLGESFVGQSYYQGFHPTGTTGVFGAALGAGKILGLNAEQLSWAQGIAGSQAAGINEYLADGTWTKRIQAGHPAMTGVLSALLAREGYTGPATIYEGKMGFVRAYSHKDQYDLNRISSEFGSRWELLLNSIKPHACCRFACPIADCALEIAQQNDFHPGDIKDVLVRVNNWMIEVLCHPRERKYAPVTEVDAQFSLPYVVAVSLTKKRCSVAEFTDEAIADPVVLEVAQKVRWQLEPEFEKLYPKVYPAAMELKTKGGKTFTAKVDYPKGDPENPVTDEELVGKFEFLASASISNQRIKRIVDTVMNLERVTDINQLTGLLR